ncbi:aromatic ring-hydroxylating oxygenase subunit alpha [Solicola sp. PLA-1-18]|uniref:aromatic ring-hydroxylating oxygenase subunit alpha n=1 Tax=Solicola sp. PLA-1-18 TaxID=3380532 RepID=UPI003B7EDC5B
MTATPDAGPANRVSESLLRTLGGRAYVDPAVFDAECERIFEQMWFCAVHVSDLPSPGSFRTVQVGRESILLTRSRRGELRGFYNVCRHRGAQLCTEDAGQARRSFQCPYHAWTYDFDGKLIAAPNLTSMPDVGREEYGLRTVHVKEWLGYVWVSLADEPESFEHTVEQEILDRLGAMSKLEAYDVAELAIGRRISYDVAANWKLIIENFMECYHCATIHPELTEVLPEFADGLAAQFFVDHGAAFGDEIQGFTVDGSVGLDTLPGIGQDRDRKYYAITIKPQVFVNLVPDHVIVHRMFPLAADRTRVEVDWLYLPSVVESGADLSASVELFHRVNEQDFEACERCQPAMASRSYAAGGVLVPSEHHIALFHDWVTSRLS